MNPGEIARELDRMLRNEADMAAKRRVWTVIDYLAIRPGDRVLDCGCGLGWFVKILGELYPSPLYGCDSDVPRLAAAQREVAGRAGLSAADILSLPYPDAAFDKIVLSEVLEHLPDDTGGLAEVCRVLKPGGRVAITVPNHDYPLLWDPVNWVRERVGAKPIRSGFFGGLWTNHERLYTRSRSCGWSSERTWKSRTSGSSSTTAFPSPTTSFTGSGCGSCRPAFSPRPTASGTTGTPDFRGNPLNLARGLFNAIDRWNDPVSDEGRTTVILSVKAEKAVKMKLYALPHETIARQQCGDPLLRHLTDKIVRLLGTPRGRVLDVGCGTGRVAVELARRASTSTRSTSNVGRGTGEGPRRRLRSGRSVFVADFKQIDPQFPDAVYDAVVCSGPGARRAVARRRHNMARVLKPGGLLIVTTPNDRGSFPFSTSTPGVRRFRWAELSAGLSIRGSGSLHGQVR